MDLNSLVQSVYQAAPAIVWTFAGLAAADDALDLVIYAESKKSVRALLDLKAVASILVADFGSRAAVAVGTAAFVAALIAHDNPTQAALAAAALAAGASTFSLKGDVQAKLRSAFPFLFPPVTPSP